MFEPGCEFAQEVADEVRGHFGELVYRTVIPRDVALSEAPSHGKSIIQYGHRSRGARGYIELAKEVIEQETTRMGPLEVKSNG